jgi:retron-type reverse transcriptase
VTQLNAGKKTAGVDGKASLTHEERLALEKLLLHVNHWKHSKLREIPIPKKDGTTRILKIPTIKDRAWQCLVKYALEPAYALQPFMPGLMDFALDARLRTVRRLSKLISIVGLADTRNKS